MSLRINSNAAAQSAYRTLGASDSALSKSIQRLSSGLKINNAGDDPAGLVISEKLRAQVSGLGQAISNAGDAVNMVKTAEGALNEVHTLLRSMRDLALHAANSGATDAASQAADQAQIANALSSINKISEETQFGNKKLLDGSAGIKANVVGSKVVSANLGASGLSGTQDINIQVTQAATHGTVSSQVYAHGTDTMGQAGSLSINGVKVEYTTNTTVDGLTSMINGVSNQSGVTAAYTAGASIALTSMGYGQVSGRVQVTDANSVFAAGAATSALGQGLNTQAKVTTAAGDVSDATWEGDGVNIKDSLGNSIALTQSAGTTVAAATKEITAVSGTLVFQVGAFAGQTREVNIGSVDGRSLGNGVVTGMTLSNIDVTSPTGAQNAIKVLDQAIADVSNIRSNLGATQKNVLETSINSLTVAKENISASESSIRDTDTAAEMVNFTKLQILNQAGISMLAQANQSSQSLLKLIG